MFLNEENQGQESDMPGFLRQMCSCRTIFIRGKPQQFVVPPNLQEARMNEALATAISEQLKPGTMPVTNVTDTAYDFATKLVRVLGPLFVVLDDVGEAFEDQQGDVASRGLFMEACKSVLVQWAQIPQMYFVVLGHARYLQALGMESTNRIYNSSFWEFVRLPLNLIKPPDIAFILTRTQVSNRDKRSLSERWGLSRDDERKPYISCTMYQLDILES
ncbi:hypothetical protein GN244_ATG11663 [Phytophthora infestans]|uniref:Crinkler (CRN) family protein n=1 Tax=Phytophthora infestans TaxID=4787 RepID=A0A833SNA3_PHYIN|nr:hypothetical protein GN244_ATG11663 [Phytophthora infestans]